MIELIDVVDVLKAQKDTWGIIADSPSSTTYDARIFYQTEVEEMKLADGSIITLTGKVFFGGIVQIGETDKLRFVDDFGKTQTYSVHGVRVIKDFGGNPMFTKVVI